VAVLDPVSSTPLTRALQNVARGKLEELVLATKKYMVVDRKRIDQVMKEHEFAQEGGIVDSKLIIEMGKSLQADFVLTSEIEKEPGYASVTCSLVDVASGQVPVSAADDVSSEATADIRYAIEKAARRVFGLPPPPPPTSPGGGSTAPPPPRDRRPIGTQPVIGGASTAATAPSTQPSSNGELTGTVRGYPRLEYEVRDYEEKRVLVRFDYTAATTFDKHVSVDWMLDRTADLKVNPNGVSYAGIRKGDIRDWFVEIVGPNVKLGTLVIKAARDWNP
jgi:hypothetical protein